MKATYIKTQLHDLFKVSKLVTIHYYEYDKSFAFGGESHDFWEMVYVDRGKVCVQSEENEIILKQGDIIFHKPNEFHAIKAYESEPNFFVISFVCHSSSMVCFEKYHTRLDKELKPFISSIIKEAEGTFIIPKNDPDLKKLVKKEAAVIGGEQLIKTYLEQLLILLARNVNQAKGASVFPSKQSMENHLTASIKKYLEQTVEQSFKMSSLCKVLGYSKSYLCKIFHEQTGATIAAYAVNIKIEHAKRLIREDNLNFSQISGKLAFDNPQYFSRVFKRITGMTPTEFKQTLHLKR